MTPAIVVTGASRGIGRALAIRCGQAGWRVAVVYHTQHRAADETAAQIRSHGGAAYVCHADVADPRSVERVVQQVIDEWGRIDIWVSNAAIVTDRLTVTMPDEAWDRVVATDLSSAAYGIRAVAPAMIRQGDGAILHVASIVGLEGRRGQSNYAAAKAGLLGLTRSAARELAPYGIRVNAACPLLLDTPLTTPHLAALRTRQLLPVQSDSASASDLASASNSALAGDSLFAILTLPWITGHTFMLDSRIAEGAL